MDVRLGLVGRGYWGNTYAKVLDELGIDYWQAGKDWKDAANSADGFIVACSTEAHYEVARSVLRLDLPVLVEKPLTKCVKQARELVELRGIGFVSHTRLYDPTWRAFKIRLQDIWSVEAWAGGVNESNPDAFWNWGSHLAAMCLDLGFCPHKAKFHITTEKQPLRFVVNGEHEFTDGPPGALKVLVTEFVEAIKRGRPNNEGMKLGLEVVRYCNTFAACGPDRWRLNGSGELHRP